MRSKPTAWLSADCAGKTANLAHSSRPNKTAESGLCHHAALRLFITSMRVASSRYQVERPTLSPLYSPAFSAGGVR